MDKKFLNLTEYKNFINKLVIIALFVWFLYLAYSVLNILFILFFSCFLVVLFSPFLNKLNKYKINDFFWILIIFLIILMLVSIIAFSVIPLIVSQTSNFYEFLSNSINDWLKTYRNNGLEGFWLPPFLSNILWQFNLERILSLLNENLSQISSFFWNNFKSILSNWAWIITWFTSWVFTFFMVIIFTFFIALERTKIKNFFYKIIPSHIWKKIKNSEWEVKTTLWVWLKWQLILSCFMFFITLISLWILSLFWIEIEGIFTLALIAGFMEFIPYIWTFISIFIALIISLWSWIDAFIAVLIIYLIIQQIEWNILVPYVMWKTLSLSPFTVLFAMTLWGSLFWIIWIIFAVPFSAVFQIFFNKYFDKK